MIFFTGPQQASKKEWDGEEETSKKSKTRCSSCFELRSEHGHTWCFVVFFFIYEMRNLQTLMGNLQTSMFFIIPSSFLTEMCFRTESIFPHRTWTAPFYTGQFRDVRKTTCPCLSVCQAEPVPQTVLLDVLPACPCHCVTTWGSSRVSPLPDGRLLEGWACCVHWTQDLSTRHTIHTQ